MTTAKFEDCGMFEKCKAPLCPLDPGLAKRVWFPGESICASRTYGAGLLWIQNQRKAGRKAKRNSTFFNIDMLKKNIIVKKGITGLDPDSKDIPGDLQKWIAAHPEITPGQMERMKQAGARLRKHHFHGDSKEKAAVSSQA